MSVAEAEPSTIADASPRLPALGNVRIRLALLFGPLPLLVAFFIQLWQQKPHYQFIVIYAAGLAGLSWNFRPATFLDGTGPAGLVQRCFLILGFTVFVPAALMFSPWLGMIAWLLILPGAVLDLLPRPAARMLAPIWLISWFVVPPPFQWDEDLLQWLRAQTSQMTGVVLDALGIIHLQAGNTFEVPGRHFFVEDACSGIHSLLSIVGVALLWSVYLRLPALATLCSVACAGIAAIVLNIFRVLAVVIGYTAWNLDLSKGWTHEVLGFALFVVAVLFLGSAQQFWRFWFEPLPTNRRRRVTKPTETELGAPQTEPRTTMQSFQLMATMALVLWIPQTLQGYRVVSAATVLRSAFAANQTALRMDDQSLPAELNGWKQIAFKTIVRSRNHAEGEFSRQWTYQTPWGHVTASLDFPYPRPHDLTKCYVSNGWTATVRRTVPPAGTEGGYQEFALSRRAFEVGNVIWSPWNERGNLLSQIKKEAPSPSFATRLWGRIASTVTTHVREPSSSTYQFQVLVTREFPLEEAEQADVLQFFLDARDHLRQTFATDPVGGPDGTAPNSTGH